MQTYSLTFQQENGIRISERTARKFYAMREIGYRNRVRGKAAGVLREIRTEVRADFATRPEAGNRLLAGLRSHITRGLPRRATRRSMITEAKRNIRFSKTPIPNYSTERYSACGAEDAAADRREAARSMGELLLVAARLLA